MSHVVPVRSVDIFGSNTGVEINFSRMGNNVNSSTVLSNPMLTITDNRRSRSSQLTNGPFSYVISHQIGGGRDPYFSFEAQFRANRTQSNSKRRTIGPLVSDRRWGADLSELESPSSRLNVLNTLFARFFATQQSNSSRYLPVTENHFEGSLLHNSISRIQDSKEEDDEPLIESKEDEMERFQQRISLPHLNLAGGMLTSTDNLNRSSGERILNHLGPSTTESADAMSLEQNRINIVDIAPVNVVELSSENMQFLDSLTFDLREEILLTAEQEFLATLPASIQEEARQLRRNRALELQMLGFSSNLSNSAPLQSHAFLNDASEIQQRIHNFTDPPMDVAPGNDATQVEDPNWFLPYSGNTTRANCLFNSSFIAKLLEWIMISTTEKGANYRYRLFTSVVSFENLLEILLSFVLQSFVKVSFQILSCLQLQHS
jgi:hypothetical protein